MISLFTLTFGLGACSDGEGEETVPAGETGAGSDYPLKVCVVSREELGSMGEPVVIEHEGTAVKFCCKSCIPKFEKDPAKYISKLKSP